MKTMKQTLFLAVATLGATVSFAQLGVGVTGNAGASATKSVNTATTGAATRAATTPCCKAYSGLAPYS